MNSERSRGIFLLLSAAHFVNELDQDTGTEVQKQDTSVEESEPKTDKVKLAVKLQEAYKARVKIEDNPSFDIDIKSIPTTLLSHFFENISDELCRRFKYRCTFSPTCSKVIESYGNEMKGVLEMKKHLINHHFLKDSLSDIEKRTKQDNNKSSCNKTKFLNLIMSKRFSRNEATKDSLKPSKKLKSIKSDWQYPQVGSNGINSVLQEPVLSDENAPVSLDTDFEADESTDLPPEKITIKYGQFEHDYAKNIDADQFSNTNLRETGQNKILRRKNDISYKFDLNEYLKRESFLVPPMIHTPRFPFVYTPCPLEAAWVVEFQSNGNPTNFMKPFFIQPSTSRISPKKPIERISRKRVKIVATNSTSRSVLECVENRVACKSNALSEQKDALVPDHSIENSENVEKSIHEIAWRNIRILSQQRRKRKYRDKPTVYVCEICKKQFTANTSLTYHYLGHLKIKPFKCHICYRTFTRRHSLKYHMMIHANKNRFQCPTCKRLFRHPSHYKEHLRKHTGEEPFSCKFCSNKFKTRNSFKRHLKMQHQKLLTSNGIVPIRNDS
ncbi:Zinc finger and BTB domain-containing protein like [Argiope bruennichi]|uniref:Zinc finger and BTB domain-containing protein like n=1 Tax=Argiope bruennichi TaxID=94029 RepID=A0A8T0EJ50_ARGBR|nr:Zinc finger and BTB domain-containing protein like [Argiope bruennichi]